MGLRGSHNSPFCGVSIREEDFMKLLRCGFHINLKMHSSMTTFPWKRFANFEMHFFVCLLYYRPQTKFAKIMFFTPVCQSFCLRGGVSASVHAEIHTPQSRHLPGSRHPPGVDTPRSRHPLEQTTPWSRHPPKQTPPCTVHAERYGQQAGGTHPTGMHTCLGMVMLGHG